ncbi:MAG: SpoVR family protein [Deltaproteobacteria bacterium CG_4_9_14_3_um_filter_63_12]|nr:MAG: SpoVR family protein [Deltaproteobacteria bacterium CG_4_9_14_3_um_filter_63_12]
MELPVHLWEIKNQLKAHAEAYGLDVFETIFEVVDYKTINEIAAYGGFPTRYNHWRFGMEYEQLSKSYEYGLSKIYEMVINNNPSYAYLLEGNNMVDQKTVIAHVYGHVDFFKNNYFFSKTNRRMMDEMANHATRVRRYMDTFGVEPIEDFIETCLSLDNLIDYYSPFILRKRPQQEKEPDLNEMGIPKLSTGREYMENYINPKEYLAEQQRKMDIEQEKKKRFPEEPEKDVLQFLMDNAPLEQWENDVLSLIREEAYYFAPQGQTKIMNEGWATYWHSRIMTEKALDGAELIDYADAFSGIVATSPGQLNPYKMGLELWRDIEDRWDRGKFGKEYEECTDLEKRSSWNRGVGQGQAKIFEVRRHYNDVTFIDEFLTEDFCRKHKLFTFAYNSKSSQYEIESREFSKIKQKLLSQMTNFGHPFIMVRDGNFKNRGELLLHHRFEGVELRMDYARDVLKNLSQIWRRPVNIETIIGDKGRLISFDGTQHKEAPCDYEPI